MRPQTAAAPTQQPNNAVHDLLPFCLRAAIGSVDVEERTAEVIFSTGAAVTRMDWWTGEKYIEVLSMDPKSVRLDRLNQAGPLLDSHTSDSVGNVFGAVVPNSARIEKGKGIATVKFSRRDDVEPYFQDVRDGIIRSISVGYRIHKFVEEKGDSTKLPTRTAVDWEPYELSLVPMPADVGAKVRKSDKFTPNQCVIEVRAALPVITDADRNRWFRLARLRSPLGESKCTHMTRSR